MLPQTQTWSGRRPDWRLQSFLPNRPSTCLCKEPSELDAKLSLRFYRVVAEACRAAPVDSAIFDFEDCDHLLRALLLALSPVRLRLETQARLIGGQSPGEIAAATQLSSQTIEYFRWLAFDVESRLFQPDALTCAFYSWPTAPPGSAEFAVLKFAHASKANWMCEVLDWWENPRLIGRNRVEQWIRCCLQANVALEHFATAPGVLLAKSVQLYEQALHLHWVSEPYFKLKTLLLSSSRDRKSEDLTQPSESEQQRDPVSVAAGFPDLFGERNPEQLLTSLREKIRGQSREKTPRFDLAI